jgi:hypothetical protein
MLGILTSVFLNFLYFFYNVTCEPIASKRVINTIPYRWILGHQFVTEHVSVDTKMKDISTEIDYWKPARRCGINRRFRGYAKATNFSFHNDKLYKRPCRSEWSQSHVEAGSNTSTVALQIVGVDEKGSLKSETVKYDHESYRARTRKRLAWRGPAAIVNDRPFFSSERSPHSNKPTNVWQ